MLSSGAGLSLFSGTVVSEDGVVSVTETDVTADVPVSDTDVTGEDVNAAEDSFVTSAFSFVSDTGTVTADCTEGSGAGILLFSEAGTAYTHGTAAAAANPAIQSTSASFLLYSLFFFLHD